MPHGPEKTAENLKKILAVNTKINSTFDLDELLGIIMSTASEVMEAEAASLMLLDEKNQELVFRVALGEKGGMLKEKFRVQIGEGIAGHVAESGRSIIVNDPQSDPRFARRFDESTGFTTRAIACVAMKSKGKTIGALQAVNPIGRAGFEEDDLRLFEAFSDQAALSVENARLHMALVREEKSKQELQIAHDIQQNFLPVLEPGTFKLDIAAFSIPAQKVGGDFYDVKKLDDSRIGIAVGDVSGKGVPAALFMVRAISEYRFLASQTADPGELLTRLNKILALESPFGMFITFFYAVVNHREKTVRYSSAGHPPLIHRQHQSTRPALRGEAGGIPLGIMPNFKYSEDAFDLAPHDLCLIYTDGILEARNPQSEEFGFSRIQQFMKGPHPTAPDCINRLKLSLEDFSRGADQHDDMTVLAFRLEENYFETPPPS